MVNVVCLDERLLALAQQAADALSVPVQGACGGGDWTLLFADGKACLKNNLAANTGDILVDFCSGGAAHRRLFGGGNGQMIAKAVGVTGRNKPSVFDGTAGLGQDAFVLACLGCKVSLMERSPVAFALLQNGLDRARIFATDHDTELLGIIQSMSLRGGDSISTLQASPHPVADVIYLDPMFPLRQKKSAVKKEMTAFHSVVGQDLDEVELLEAALAKATFRVVVKRPRLAPAIGDRAPSTQHLGKSSRFDIYALKSFAKA